MESELKRNRMTCHVNGEICCDGIRTDFKPDPLDGKVKQCRQWTAVKGKDPQSETHIDFFDCSFAWVPVVTLEASQMTRQNTATMQEFRNETHEGLQKLGNGLKQAALAIGDVLQQNQELIEGVPLPSLENKENNGHEN